MGSQCHVGSLRVGAGKTPFRRPVIPAEELISGFLGDRKRIGASVFDFDMGRAHASTVRIERDGIGGSLPMGSQRDVLEHSVTFRPLSCRIVDVTALIEPAEEDISRLGRNR